MVNRTVGWRRPLESWCILRPQANHPASVRPLGTKALRRPARMPEGCVIERVGNRSVTGKGESNGEDIV
jgi:hypothetical protein